MGITNLEEKDVKLKKILENFRNESIKKEQLILGSILKIRESIVFFNNFLDESRYENFIIFSHIGFNRLLLFMKINIENSWNNFHESKKVDSFESLLNNLLYYNKITKQQRKELMDLNDKRNQIAHRFILSNNLVSNEEFLFSLKIIRTFNEIIEKIDNLFRIKENIINFQETYGSSIISEKNITEEQLEQNNILLATSNITPENEIKVFGNFRTSSGICKMLMEKYSNLFEEDEEFSSGYHFHLFRKKFNIIKNKDGKTIMSLEKEFNLINEDKNFFIIDKYEKRKIRYRKEIVDIFANYIKDEKKKNKSFQDIINDVKQEIKALNSNNEN